MDSDRTLTQKIILWALLGLAVVFTVVYVVLKFLPGVAFEDTLLKVAQQGEQTLYTGEKYKYLITVTVTPEDEGSRVELTIGNAIDHTYRVEYPGGTITTAFGTYDRITITCNDRVIFDGGYDPDVSSVKFCDLNGDALLPYMFGVNASDDPWHNFELSGSQVLSFAEGPETTTRGNWAYYVAALVASVIGAVSVAFPYTLFELRYHWSVKDPEPTDFYLRMNELGGGVVVCMILIAYIIGATRIV